MDLTVKKVTETKARQNWGRSIQFQEALSKNGQQPTIPDKTPTSPEFSLNQSAPPGLASICTPAQALCRSLQALDSGRRPNDASGLDRRLP
jgi:hypothetical protein